jgi:hypothetical protein
MNGELRNIVQAATTSLLNFAGIHSHSRGKLPVSSRVSYVSVFYLVTDKYFIFQIGYVTAELAITP